MNVDEICFSITSCFNLRATFKLKSLCKNPCSMCFDFNLIKVVVLSVYCNWILSSLTAFRRFIRLSNLVWIWAFIFCCLKIRTRKHDLRFVHFCPVRVAVSCLDLRLCPMTRVYKSWEPLIIVQCPLLFAVFSSEFDLWHPYDVYKL